MSNSKKLIEELHADIRTLQSLYGTREEAMVERERQLRLEIGILRNLILQAIKQR